MRHSLTTHDDGSMPSTGEPIETLADTEPGELWDRDDEPVQVGGAVGFLCLALAAVAGTVFGIASDFLASAAGRLMWAVVVVAVIAAVVVIVGPVWIGGGV